tara:strand:+ start:41 stop:574 length:534 start_codon:yes stop_codon:yes gene_type:complete
MGTLSIDAEQSAQIVKLQEDVEELTTKLNAVVTDIATIKGKVDTLITDVNAIKLKIVDSTGYPTTGVFGVAGDTIYERLYQLDTDVADITSQLDSHISDHPGIGNQGNASRASGGGVMDDMTVVSTSSSGSVSQTASAASTTGTYNTSNINVVTLNNDAATRAREVARSSLTKLRDL